MPTNYTLMDATLEILLMSLAAFLLGWLFCWLMKKLLGRKLPDTVNYNHDIDTPDTNLQAKRSARTGLSASSRDRLYDPEVGIPRVDIETDIPTINKPNTNLGDIETLDLDIETPEIKLSRPRIDLPELNTPDVDLPDLNIKGKVDAGLDVGKGTLGKGLGVAAAGIGAVAAGAVKNVDLDINAPDVECPIDATLESGKNTLDAGIDGFSAEVDLPEVPTLDHSTEIDLPEPELSELDFGAEIPEIEAFDLPTEVELPEAKLAGLDLDMDLELSNVERLKADLDHSEINLPAVDTTDLSGAVDSTIDSGKGALGKGLGAAAAGLGAVTTGAASLKDKAADSVDGLSEGLSSVGDSIDNSAADLKDKATEKASELGDKLSTSSAALKDPVSNKAGEVREELTQPDLPKHASNYSSDGNVASRQEGDDLTRINGVDDDIARLLREKGIDSFKTLQNTHRNTLKDHLKSSGDASWGVIEPASWPHQAKLCASKNWTKLNEYQAFLSSSNLSGAGESADTTHSAEDSSKDDLKKIEGIGPFFESLLNDAGITTYEQLKTSSRDSLKEVIDTAGPDYRMHEPETWPYQAGLADAGEWKKLQDYIQFMTGRN